VVSLAGDWLAERTLSSLGLTEEGVLVTGVHLPNDRDVDVSTGAIVIYASDTLVIYEPSERGKEFDMGPRGISGGLVDLMATSEKMRLVQGLH
jgi:hypothetical protein